MIKISDFFMTSTYQKKLAICREQLQGDLERIQSAFNEQLMRSFLEELGESLKTFMNDHKLSQRSCAKVLGVSQSEVSRLVNGRNSPSIGLLLRLRLLLGSDFRIEPEDFRLIAYGAGASVVRQVIYGETEDIPTEARLRDISDFLETAESRWSLESFISQKSRDSCINESELRSSIENWAIPFELCREVIDG